MSEVNQSSNEHGCPSPWAGNGIARSEFAIGVLSVTAVVLFVSLLLVQSTPRTALGNGIYRYDSARNQINVMQGIDLGAFRGTHGATPAATNPNANNPSNAPNSASKQHKPPTTKPKSPPPPPPDQQPTQPTP
jgi:hypothetical protein